MLKFNWHNNPNEITINLADLDQETYYDNTTNDYYINQTVLSNFVSDWDENPNGGSDGFVNLNGFVTNSYGITYNGLPNNLYSSIIADASIFIKINYNAGLNFINTLVFFV